MSKTMENLIEQYVEAVKKIYGHIYDRSFYMVPMQEKISDRIQM